jgi:hypothetical protein
VWHRTSNDFFSSACISFTFFVKREEGLSFMSLCVILFLFLTSSVNTVQCTQVAVFILWNYVQQFIYNREIVCTCITGWSLALRTHDLKTDCATAGSQDTMCNNYRKSCFKFNPRNSQKPLSEMSSLSYNFAAQGNRSLRCLYFSQSCYWIFKSFKMWRCIFHQVILDVSKESITFVFKG